LSYLSIYFYLFFPVLLSGLSVFLLKTSNRRILKLVLAFSGSYLFGLCVTHLIPQIYLSGTPEIGIFVLVGFFIQILLEFFSEGIEHGHIHVHKEKHGSFPLLVILSLCMHSFLEGMPLSQKEEKLVTPLLMGIVLHNIPVSFALMSMLLESGINRKKALLWLTVFGLMSPLGLVFSNILLSRSFYADISLYFDRIMAIVIGIFLHISTTILFESTEDHRFNLYKFAVIMAGAAMAIAL
jgi:zinc and cadmium transporter